MKITTIVNKTLSLIYSLLKVLLIVLVFIGLYRIGRELALKMDNIDSSMLAVIISGFITITGFFIKRYFERKKEIERQIQKHKVHIYDDFISYYFRKFETIGKNTGNNNPVEKEELIDIIWDLKKKSILWLSDDTFKAFLDWENKSWKVVNKLDINEKIIVSFISNLIDLILKFRKDIGHKNKNIDNVNLSESMLGKMFLIRENQDKKR
jgi:hypothetical protein